MSQAKLLIGRGAVPITRDDLAHIEPPPSTSTWTTVKHSSFVDMLCTELASRNLQVTHEEYAIQRNGKQLFGTLDLDWQDTGEYAAAMGLRTSNDKSLSITLVAGLHVWICSNLCFSGDLIALKRKHTKHLNLTQELSGAIDRYQAGVLRLSDDVERLKDTPISVEQSKVMVYDIFRKKIVPIRLFRPVTETLSASIEAYGLNPWWVHNAFTSHIKTLPPAPAFKSTVRLGQFFSLN